MKKKAVSPARAKLNQKKEGQVVFSPRLTEKATQIAEGNTYTFNVAKTATKIQIREAIKALYTVTPIAVNLVTRKQQQVVVRGKRGTRAGGKKAYVTLKKGDTISLM